MLAGALLLAASAPPVWSAPPVSSDQFESHPAFDPWTGDLLSAADAYYRSERTKTGWSPRVRLGPEINVNGSEIGAALSPSGRSWLFARDMKDGRSGELLLAGNREGWPKPCPRK